MHCLEVLDLRFVTNNTEFRLAILAVSVLNYIIKMGQECLAFLSKGRSADVHTVKIANIKGNTLFPTLYRNPKSVFEPELLMADDKVARDRLVVRI